MEEVIRRIRRRYRPRSESAGQSEDSRLVQWKRIEQYWNVIHTKVGEEAWKRARVTAESSYSQVQQGPCCKGAMLHRLQRVQPNVHAF